MLDSVPTNLVGCSIWFTVKKTRTDADSAAIVVKTIENGGIVLTDGPGGLFRLYLTPDDCALILTKRGYFWDVTIRFPSGEVHTPTGMSGDIVASANVRRTAA